jgi:anti-anti-sigma factor
VLKLDIHQRTDCLLLCAGGELDVETSVTFRQRLTQLMEQGLCPLVVDLTDLRFVDSCGLGALMVTLRMPEAARPRFVVAPGNQHIGRLLRATRMDHLLPVYPSIEAALAGPSLRSAA